MLQPALWDRLLNLPAAFFRRFSAGDLAERALGISQLQWLISDTVALSMLSALFSVTNFALLFAYDPVMALVAAALVIGSVLVTLAFGRAQLGFERRRAELRGETSGLVLQLLSGVAKLRVAGAEDRAFGVWAEVFARQQRVILAGRRIQAGLSVFVAAYPVVASMFLFALMLSRSTLSVGEFLAFNLAFSQLNIAAAQLSGAIVSVLSAAPYLTRLQPILQTPPEVNSAARAPEILSGAVRMQNLNFRYAPDRPLALAQVSFSVQPGEFVAIVGASGSGKSTLVRLLIGFETPESGAVFYGDQPLDQLDRPALRRQMGVVLQNAQVIAGDILGCISPSRSEADAWRAAGSVGLETDIRALPMGLHTYVSEEGSTFSGGQRQRLLIARALAANPRIVILDEATSSLDQRVQAQVMAALERLGMTLIVVAHRASTVAHADRILVLRGGEIVESGSYADLLAAGGTFAALAQQQFQ